MINGLNGKSAPISTSTTAPRELSYQTRQAMRNAEYRDAYKVWMRKCTGEERQQFKQLHVDRPLIDYHISESPKDISDRNLAEPMQPESTTHSHSGENERIMMVLLRISDASNPRLEVATLQFVFGFTAQMGVSGSQIAAKYGLSRAAFSKRCKELQKELRVSPSRAMKSQLACHVYAQTNGAMKTQWSRLPNTTAWSR